MQADYFSSYCTKLGDKNYTALLSFFVISLFVLAFLFQGSRGIWQPDEGYYTGSSVTMLNKSSLLIPVINEEVFLDKPPVTYWGIIAGVKLFGQTEFGARAFTALCYVLTVIIIIALGHSIFKERYIALIGGVFYATMILPFIAANFITPDTPLVLCTTLVVFFFWNSVKPDARRVNLWKVLLCFAVGLGFLTKGPAVLVPCAGMFIYLVVRRRVVRYFITPWFLLGIFIFICVGLSWYIYVSFRQSGAAFYFFDNMVWGRLFSKKYNRNPGVIGMLIYIPILVFGTLPWSMLFVEKVKDLRKVFKLTWWIELKQRPVALFLVCMFAVPVLILFMASSRLGLYALPVFPIAALAASKQWARKMLKQLKSGNKTPRKIFLNLAVFIMVWMVLLLSSKLAIALYPNHRDCRALWDSMKEYIPEGDYEIVTIDTRADGLLFYGAAEVENVTVKDEPYPSFMPPETVHLELQDLDYDRCPFLFLISGQKKFEYVRDIIRPKVKYYEQARLPFDRWLIICSNYHNQGTDIEPR